MCRRCSFDVCFDCGVHDNCVIERSQHSQKTLRSVFKEYGLEHQRSVVISTTYDIVSPGDGHMRRHQHKRGLGVGEDCRYAVFSDATMNVDTPYHLPPPEKPAEKHPADQPVSADPLVDFAQAVVRRCMQLVDVVAGEVEAGHDCLDQDWSPKRPERALEPIKSGFLVKHHPNGSAPSQLQERYFVLSRGMLQWHKDASTPVIGAVRLGANTSITKEQELRVKAPDSELILSHAEGPVLDEWARVLEHEAKDELADCRTFGPRPCLSRFKDLNSAPSMDCDPSMLAWLLEGDDAPRGYSVATVGRYADKIDALIQAASQLMKSQPIVSDVTAPAKVFGDIHGQLRDLLLLFHFYGRPDDDEEEKENDDEPISYVFNGDWVDRGRHQLEVMVLILSLKIIYPNQVWLNRGNHEDRQQNLRTSKIGSLGFDKACMEALGLDQGRRIFDSFQGLFEWLPLAARVEHKVLVLHGGLGPGDWTLDDLSMVERPLTSKELHFAMEGTVYNILWSDPLSHKPENRRDPMKSFGVHDSPRDKHWQVMKNFGRDVTQRFCKQEGLELVIRSHQFTNTCKGYELLHDGYLLRVFSARNYMGTVPNDGGMLLIGYGEDARGAVSLVVRPRSIERLTGPSRARQNTGGAVLSCEPYCPRKHLMQLIKPEEVRCFGWTHRDSEDFRFCAECGMDDLQEDCFFACRGCGDYDLCLECASRVSQGLQALPAFSSCSSFSPPSRSVESESSFLMTGGQSDEELHTEV